MSVDLDKLEGLIAKATPGPWEDDHEKNEGSYGLGDDIHEGYNSAVILGPDGKRLFDAQSSDAAHIHEDAGVDEIGPYHSAWDETSIRNAELIVAAVNALPALIAELRSLRDRPGGGGDSEPRLEAKRDMAEIFERRGPALKEAVRGLAAPSERELAWDRDRACAAASVASTRFGQWVPQRWLDLFMAAYDALERGDGS